MTKTKWKVSYLPEVADDLIALGIPAAKRIRKVIRERIQDGEPDKLGKPLGEALAGCRRIRTGDTRIIYRVNVQAREVLIIAVGPRRGSEVYDTAEDRI